MKTSRAGRALVAFFVFSHSFPHKVQAQCHYPVSLKTSRDYCVGSTLRVSSTHAIQKIIWYQDGQLVDSVQAQQSLSTTGVTVAGGNGGGPNYNQIDPSGIAIDESGNLYIANSGVDDIRRWPAGASSAPPIAKVSNIADIALDGQGNVYATDRLDHRVDRWSPITNSLQTVATIPVSSPYTNALAAGLAIDCAGNIYSGDYSSGNVYKFSPGSEPGSFNTGSLVAHLVPTNNTLGVCVDAAGLVINSPALNLGAIWSDGLDTLYSVDNGCRILKWAPGATVPTPFLGGNTPGSGAGQFRKISSMTMDGDGNVYVGDAGNYRVQKFTRTSTIDTTFTPISSGQYYAVVTDIRGYTETTTPVLMNVYLGPPSITILAPPPVYNGPVFDAPVCTSLTFTAGIQFPGTDYHYQWKVSGVPVGTDKGWYTNNIFADSDQVYCVLTTSDICTGRPFTVTSNVVTLIIDPHGTASVKITTADTIVCKGGPAVFNATVTNGAAQPVFQWLLNGNPVAGDDSAAYHSDSLSNSDVVTCLITSDNECGLAKSNSIPIQVIPPPAIASNQVFDIPYGQSLTLDPATSGSITTWLWTPGTGLSDSTIRDPVADPTVTTNYKLTVSTPGCAADSGYILVDVYTPLSMPNAFTPNGDGHNDILYVLGGPINSVVEDFAVFNRWGEAVFQTHNAAPGDPTRGWNGYLHGQPAPPDTYAYQVQMRYADGSHKIYRGTVLLIR